MFNNTRQHDAQEFMHCLLDNLQADEATISNDGVSGKRQKLSGATEALQGSLVWVAPATLPSAKHPSGPTQQVGAFTVAEF
jgi:hypothetical protein